jgi:transposase
MDIDILGIDLAKRVFQLHGADRRGHALHGSKVQRAELLGAVRNLQPRVVAMVACSSAHHWGRQFQAMGIEVRLISPQYVAPFVKTNKNDANDAAAIVEAASRPTMHFVTVKSVEQQDMRAVLIKAAGMHLIQSKPDTCMLTISIYKKKLAKRCRVHTCTESVPSSVRTSGP